MRCVLGARPAHDAAGHLVHNELEGAGEGSFNLACYAALVNDHVKCLMWLERCDEHGTLQTKSHIENDMDFDVVRYEPWFIAFMEKHFPEQ